MDAYLSPHLDRSALITIDVQQDTLDGQPCEVPGTSAILPSLRKAVGWFRAQAKPIVHVVRLYQADGSNVDLCRRAAVQSGAQLFLAGSPGSQLADGILPEAGIALEAHRLLAGELQRVGEREWLMYKPRWGAFFKTPLESHLQALGVSTLVFVGCNYPNCPRTVTEHPKPATEEHLKTGQSR